MQLLELLHENNVVCVSEGEHKHARPGWIQMDCPFCGKGTGKFHLGYSLSGNYFNCWKCGGHHQVSVLVELLNISFDKAKKLVGGLETTAYEVVEKRGTLKLPKGIGPLKKQHIKYLQSRGFTKAHADLWQVQGIGIAAKLRWRLFIPIHYRGDVVSWTTRAIGKNVEMRYLSAAAEQEAINHKHLLYGEDFVQHAVVCVEGPLDAWKIGPGAVASCGTGYSSQQVLKLSKYPIRAICFDRGDSAQRRAVSLADQLSAFPGKTFNVELDAEDAGAASEKELRKLRKAFGL